MGWSGLKLAAAAAVGKERRGAAVGVGVCCSNTRHTPGRRVKARRISSENARQRRGLVVTRPCGGVSYARMRGTRRAPRRCRGGGRPVLPYPADRRLRLCARGLCVRKSFRCRANSQRGILGGGVPLALSALRRTTLANKAPQGGASRRPSSSGRCFFI